MLSSERRFKYSFTLLAFYLGEQSKDLLVQFYLIVYAQYRIKFSTVIRLKTVIEKRDFLS